jgi:hypothetical protein
MDPENILTEGQHGSSRPKIKTTNTLLFREGIGSLTPTPKSYAEEDKGVDENDDEADWATTNTTNEAQGRHKVNPETAERREVNPEKGDDAKSNPLPQPGFGGAEPILMLMDQNMTLSKGQHPSTIAQIKETTNLGIDIKPDLEIAATISSQVESQHPYTNPIPVRLNFDLNAPLPMV